MTNTPNQTLAELEESNLRHWRDAQRTPLLATVRALLDYPTLNVEIVQRALSLILENTSNDEYPAHEWWCTCWNLLQRLENLAMGGWPEYFTFLKVDCIEGWEANFADHSWFPATDIPGYIRVMTAELDASREAMMLEGFAALFE